MGKKLEQVYNDFLNSTQEGRILTARITVRELTKYFLDKGFSEDKVLKMLLGIVGIFIAADRAVSHEELEVMNAIFDTNLNEEDVNKFVLVASKDSFFNTIDDFVDTLPKTQKLQCCIIALTIISSDGNITDNEKKEFEKFLE